MQDATSITMAGKTVVAQRVIGGARVAPGVAVARQTGRLGLGETVVQIAGQVRRAISRGQQHDRTNCDRPDENRQPCPTKVPLHREYVTLPNVQRALTRDALLILLVVLAAGTLANFIPSRHLAWWGKGQEPPQVDVDFRLIDPGSAEVMRTSLPGVVFLDTRSAASFAARPRSDIAIGARVFHEKFGYGQVRGQEGNKLEIDFDKAGIKRVIDSFVTLAK